MKFRNMTGNYLFCKDEILLLYRKNSRVGKDSWRGIGGHMEAEELNNPRSCALRELKEESTLDVTTIQEYRLKYIAMRNVQGEVRLNYYYVGEIKKEDLLDMSSDEGVLRWHSFDESLLSLTMPTSAKAVLKHALAHPDLLEDNKVYTAICHGADYTFTPLIETL